MLRQGKIPTDEIIDYIENNISATGGRPLLKVLRNLLELTEGRTVGNQAIQTQWELFNELVVIFIYNNMISQKQYEDIMSIIYGPGNVPPLPLLPPKS